MPGNDVLTFDQILAASDLPPPGPEHYLARRRLWLTPKPNSDRRPSQLHPQLQGLEELFMRPNAIEDDRVWRNGPERIWRNLSSGAKMKKRMPMSILIKIIHSAWVRDETWPAGAVAPDPDDVLLEPTINNAPEPGASSGAASPWLEHRNNHNQLSLDQVARDF